MLPLSHLHLMAHIMNYGFGHCSRKWEATEQWGERFLPSPCKSRPVDAHCPDLELKRQAQRHRYQRQTEQKESDDGDVAKCTHLGLVSVELKSVGSHPPAHVAYAVRNTALELGTVTRLTETVNLSVVDVEVGSAGRTHEPVETDLQCKEET